MKILVYTKFDNILNKIIVMFEARTKADKFMQDPVIVSINDWPRKRLTIIRKFIKSIKQIEK